VAHRPVVADGARAEPALLTTAPPSRRLSAVKAIAIELDPVLGDTRPIWDGWLEEAARRYSSIAKLDPDSLPHDRGAAAEELDRWARRGIGDWRHALERYAEDHAALHLRPDPDVGAALRALTQYGVAVGVFTDGPEPLARVALAHLGATRRVDHLETGAGALDRLLARLGPEATVVRTRDQLTAERITDRSRH
jgi:phosphoglycolate phosphatase-like HAD superfamily hydrolase